MGEAMCAMQNNKSSSYVRLRHKKGAAKTGVRKELYIFKVLGLHHGGCKPHADMGRQAMRALGPSHMCAMQNKKSNNNALLCHIKRAVQTGVQKAPSIY